MTPYDEIRALKMKVIQLNAERTELEAERAKLAKAITALTFYRDKYERFGQGWVGCAADALAALQAPEVKE